MNKFGKSLNDRLKIITIVFILIATILAVYYFHVILKKETIFTHFFYIPIMLSAIWWKRKGLLVTLILSLLLIFSHNYLKIDIYNFDDYFRSLFFIFVGVIIAMLSERNEKASERILVEKERLDVTLKSIYDAVITTDNDGNITLLNKTAAMITGWDQLKAVGKPVDLIFHKRFKKKAHSIKTAIIEALKNDYVIKSDDEIHIKLKNDRDIIITYNAAPIHNKSGDIIGIVLVLHDVTENKKLFNQLMQSEKFSAIGQLSIGIAHEFNNILTVIKGRAQLLKAYSGTKGIQKKYLDIIDQQADKGNDIVNNLNTTAIPNPPALEITDIISVTDQTIKIVRDQFKLLNITIQSEYKKCLKLSIDTGQIQQVLLNLLFNARDAIVIANRKNGHIQVSIEDHKDFVHILVSDNGIGVNKGIRDKILNPFFTTKDSTTRTNSLEIRGVGLGLAVTYSIVKQHNGNISFESRENEGTVFKIELPKVIQKSTLKVDKQKPDIQKEIPITIIRKIKNLKILVVDDEKEITCILSELLGNIGSNYIITANNGKQVLTSINDNNFDLIFLDYYLPDTDGNYLYKKICKISPETAVVFISAISKVKNLKAVKQKKAGFIQKPFDLKEIINVLYRISEKKEVNIT